jgi:hypothetical protein
LPQNVSVKGRTGAVAGRSGAPRGVSGSGVIDSAVAQEIPRSAIRAPDILNKRKLHTYHRVVLE